MADFICERNCSFQKGNGCELGLTEIQGDIAMPGFCPALKKISESNREEKEGGAI